MVGFTSRLVVHCLVAAFLALFAVYDGSAQQYRVTDLGALGFTPIPDSRGSLGINNKGQVALGRDPQPPFNLDEIQAAIWLPEADYGLAAGIHLLQLPPGHTLPSILRDVNVHGQFVGQVSGILAGEGEAVVYDLGADPSETRLLGFLPDGGWSRAMAITDASPAMVVGESELEAVKCDPCSNDTAQVGLRSFWVTMVEDPLSLFQLLPLLDCPEQDDASSYARDVSIVSGVGRRVAGFSGRAGPTAVCAFNPGPGCPEEGKDAVVWSPTFPVELAGLSPLRDSEGRGINSAGQACGWVYLPPPEGGCRFRAAVWDTDLTFFNLGSVMPDDQDGDESRAEAVNNLPQPRAVGWNETQRLALLWINQGGFSNWSAFDLNDLIPQCSQAKIDLRQAHDINDDNWVIAVGDGDKNLPGTQWHAFVLTPIETCLWDLNGDGEVGILDLLALLAAWGPCTDGEFCFADFDCDGSVGILDLLTLLANWGPCPVPGGVAGASFEEELANAGLSQADWDAFKECMNTGTQAEQDNCLCWMQYYLNGCASGPSAPCSDHDPFTDCVGDLNGDCCVDKLDADILLNQLGPCPAGPGACLGDLNGDCVVDRLDHSDLLSHFGACPTTQFCTSSPPGCGTTTTAGLEESVTLMGFSGVADYQAHISATSEGEAFVCACVLQVLLEAQP